MAAGERTCTSKPSSCSPLSEQLVPIAPAVVMSGVRGVPDNLTVTHEV